ncbi:MAG TPA: hypothetical protein VGL56_20880 [Fimbriimonadaceae bacterium]|jgi:hypothetical protein
MSTTGTSTRTFTVADIRKVVDNFAADFSMMAQSTGLRSRESVALVVSDLKIFAEAGFLVNVALILRDSSGKDIRGAEYVVSNSAAGWNSDRPGNALWPQTPGGSLRVVATLSRDWWDMTEAARVEYRSGHGIHSAWGITTDTTLSGLSATTAQQYASNGYGWQRTNYN